MMPERLKTNPKIGRWDFVVMSAATIALAGAAFAPGLLHTGRRLAPVTPLAAMHGIISAAWLLLFLTQAVLVARQRTDIHRRLGFVSIALAVLLVGTGYRTAIAMARRGFDLSGDLNINADPLTSLVFPLGDLVTFVILCTAGLLYRQRPEIHKRLMLLATVGMMTPAALAHLVGHNFPSASGLFVPLLAIAFLTPGIYDRLRFGRFHRVTLWGGILLFVWGNVRALVISPSTTWKYVAAWLIQ